MASNLKREKQLLRSGGPSPQLIKRTPTDCATHLHSDLSREVWHLLKAEAFRAPKVQQRKAPGERYGVEKCSSAAFLTALPTLGERPGIPLLV